MICWELSADTGKREDKWNNKKEWEERGTYYMYAHTNLSIRQSIILQISSILSFFSIISLISIYLS